MIQKIEQFIQQHNMIESKDLVVVGVSGGADSVCLLDVLCHLKKRMRFGMVAVHVNHMIRGKEADADEKYVKELCENYNVPLKCVSIDVTAMAKNTGMTVEEAGRKARYETFWSIEGVTKVAVAHHANDLAETMLFHMTRGSSLRGIGSIRPVRDGIIRPLLCVERKQIEEYLESRKIKYCIDSTNCCVDYTRNRIRNIILPEITRGINPEAIGNMKSLAFDLQESYDYIHEQAAKVLEEVRIKSDEPSICCEKMLKEPTIIRREVIMMMLAEIAATQKDITRKHIEQVEALLQKNVSARVDLPYGITAQREYESIVFYSKEDICKENTNAVADGYYWGLQESVLLSEENIQYKVLEQEGIWENITNDYTKVFDYDKIKDKLSIRKRQPGDYLVIDSTGKTKSLNRYFIDQKIPQKVRDLVWVVADGKHILWVLGQRMSEYYKVDENTQRILVIEVRRNKADV